MLETWLQKAKSRRICLVNAMHITASVFINDNEGGLLHDYKKWLEGLAPHEPLNNIDIMILEKIMLMHI